MMRALVVVVATTFSLAVLCSGGPAKNRQLAPRLTVELITRKREFKTGEPWFMELKATVSAEADTPLTIRAWTHFFADYAVIPEFHGPFDEATLSDVLSTGGQIWRDGEAVVMWNAPDPKIFRRAAETRVAAGGEVSANFYHSFGWGLKPGHFRHKLWFAVVTEPKPNTFMLLFARQPIDVTFNVVGKEIKYDSSFQKKLDEWLRTEGLKKCHNSQHVIDPPKRTIAAERQHDPLHKAKIGWVLKTVTSQGSSARCPNSRGNHL